MDCLLRDIVTQRGYIAIYGQDVAGYLCVDFGGESAYDVIDGRWLSNNSYVVVHRLAVASGYRNKGIASEAFNFVENLAVRRDIKSLRVDTGFENKIMQRILNKCGLHYCGIVQLPGGERLAFEKLL